MQATPATWRLLLETGWEGNRLLKILCGGEAWPPELAAALLPRCASLWNMYGPTETTVWSAVARIERQQGPDRAADRQHNVLRRSIVKTSRSHRCRRRTAASAATASRAVT